MNERQFQGWIIDVAKTHGWRVYHVPTPMRPIGNNKFVPDSRGAGLADLLLLHESPPRMILAEVKGEDGVLSDAQKEFLSLARGVAESIRRFLADLPIVPGDVGMASSPLQVFVFNPSHRDLIEAVLSA